METAPERERQTRISLVLGIVVWFLHLNITYGLTSLACRWGWFSFVAGGLSGLHVMQIVITLAAMAIMVVLIYRAWRHWRAFQTQPPAINPHLLADTEKDRRPLIAFVAMLANSLFLLFIVAQFVPLFALNACSQG